MTYRMQTMEAKHKLLIKDLNPILTCTLCGGYLVDATVLTDCLHVFCRGCIIRYFENCKTACPTCNVLYKKKNQTCFRSDPQIQSLVYKVVPGLYSKEMQRREDFYRSTGVRASSSCSDDSVIERERDNLNDQEALISAYVGDKAEFFSPEDSISLSLEYYKARLDVSKNPEPNKNGQSQQSQDQKVQVVKDVTNPSANKTEEDKTDIKIDDNLGVSSESEHKTNGSKADNTNASAVNIENEKNVCVGKRYLQCPAAVSMQHLQKFVRMKYGLTANHRVDIIYEGEVLPPNFSLMDVAYSFKWNRSKPMRFFYRIFTPMKIRPIKIINTTSSTGGKQLQIVQMKSSSEHIRSEKQMEKPEKKSEKPEKPRPEQKQQLEEESEEQTYHKERLLAHLQLQSKHKKHVHKKSDNPNDKDYCVYEYQEPDQEEIKKFAEKRDREWAMQKKLDDKSGEHVSKKRKKSKHSKNESVHKKRKLHAEITSNEEEDLKLKVKIRPHNGHKHKHHRNSQNHSEKNSELTAKEKLLQMRQVRHKPISSEDKIIQTVPTTSSDTVKESIVDKSGETIKQNKEEVEKEKKNDNDPSRSLKFVDIGSSVSIGVPTEFTKPAKVPQVVPSTFTAGPSKTTAKTEWGGKAPVAKPKKAEQITEEQKKFLKTFQSYTEKYNKSFEKIKADKIEARQKSNNVNAHSNARPMTNLEQKISNLKQQCTVESKPLLTQPDKDKVEKMSNTDKNVLNPYPPGFTVSKIETGVKRKSDAECVNIDKRPSLEITLIKPQTPTPILVIHPGKPCDKSVQKRPPPPTIPLERIRKSINLKPGIRIIPKSLDVRDNVAPLDLSNKSPETSPKLTGIITKKINGINMIISNRSTISNNSSKPSGATPDKPTHQLSNLQMLSKVATEHPNLKQAANQQNKLPRTQIPNLQTLNVPSIQNTANAGASTSSKPNLPKLPKLNEINKTQFRMSSPQIRSLRPNQNQNIRNIPNPSLLVRQQNQNRLNSINSMNIPSADKVDVMPNPVMTEKLNVIEKKEISV